MSSIPYESITGEWGGAGGAFCITLPLPITRLADLTPVQPSKLLEPCYVNVPLS